MRYPRLALPAALTAIALCSGATPAAALRGAPGGTQAPASPSSPSTGGAAPGTRAVTPSTRAAPPRTGGAAPGSVSSFTAGGPVLSRLSVPRSAAAGSPPRVTLRLDEPGVGTVYVRVSVTDLTTRRLAISVTLGWVRTGHTSAVRWPAGVSLAPGRYQVSVSAHDHRGGMLLRQAHSSGSASLTVTAPAPAPATTPAPATPAPQAPPTEAGVPTPAQSAAGAVFPVAGPHTFGGPENRFGAPRGTHIHQGQDVLTAEGTPVLAPLAGTISWTSYQEGGAGYYAVEHTAVGLDLMFAHCQASSLAVSAGQAVTAGQLLCHAGQTGDATTPHLHFEMWVGGWQSPGGHPIDPLPYLEAWEHPAGP